MVLAAALAAVWLDLSLALESLTLYGWFVR
jgi:hypothetical protein